MYSSKLATILISSIKLSSDRFTPTDLNEQITLTFFKPSKKTLMYDVRKIIKENIYFDLYEKNITAISILLYFKLGYIK